MNTPAPGGVSSRHILSNTAWNLVGRVAPLFVALLVTPKLIHLMGLSRWGIFTIALGLVSSFGIFDLGLGRALTRAIADAVHNGEDRKAVADLTRTGTLTLGSVGIIGGLFAAVAVKYWVHHGLKVPPEMEQEATEALWVLCATAPLVMLNSAMWGTITAWQAFRAVNLVNAPISVMYYIGPMIVLMFSQNLVWVMMTLAACRLWMTVSYFRICVDLMPELKTAHFRPALLRPLMRLGGWITVSNVAFPLLLYFDRFIVASLVPVARTSFYTTPQDVVGRFGILSNAVAGSAFPAFAASWRKNVPTTVELFRTSTLTMSALMFPACFLAAMYSHVFLSLWIDPGFADSSALIMKILCVGVFASALDSISAGFLDAIGRPDASARLSIGELCISIPVLYVLVEHYGITGAALAWSLRSVADMLIRTLICLALYKPLSAVVPEMSPVVIPALLAICLPLIPMSMPVMLAFTVIVPAVCYGLLWSGCLTPAERAAFLRFVRKMTGKLTGKKAAE